MKPIRDANDDKPDPNELLEKSKDSVISGIQIYNNPYSQFRTEAYLVHMVIAWNSLLQAIFIKKGLEIYEQNDDGTYITIGERNKTKSLGKLVSEYFLDQNDPRCVNLDFIIQLRNEVEHSLYVNLEESGVDLFGECQSLLLNYETVLAEEFVNRNGLDHKIGLAIQLSKKFVDEQVDSLTVFAKKANLTIKKFIESYRSKISMDTYNDQRFRFSIFMIPKLSNNKHADDLPVIFNNELKLDQGEVLGKSGFLTIKTKSIEVPVQKHYHLKPSDVVTAVKQKSNRTGFKVNLHTNCWKKYGVRPKTKDPGFKNEYALFDDAHKDYVYSEKWVDFLVGKFANDEEYESILKWRAEHT